MRRFLLWVFVSCTALSVAFSLWPRQLGGYLAMFSQHTSVNRGVAVTVLGVLTLLLAALRVRLWRSERDLARIRRGLLERPPPALVYPPGPWGSRPAR
jgi:membrane protein DedA with SNARE-associated domain